jgi:CubicO group peptidase (beta-lactamase class C family)
VENAEDPDSIAARAASLGGAFDPPSDRWHHSRFAAAEFPGSNLVTDARSLARMYAAVVGDVGDCRLLKPRTVETMCVVQTSKSAAYGVPAGVTMPPFPMSLGFMRPSQLLPLLGSRSFGHQGAGGSFGLADPRTGVGFGYVMNRWSGLTDHRAERIMEAVSACAA